MSVKLKNSSIGTSIGVVVTEFPPSILLLPSPPTRKGPIRSSARIDQSGGLICGLRQLLLFISLEPPIRTEKKTFELKPPPPERNHKRRLLPHQYHTCTLREIINPFSIKGVRK